MTDPRNSSTGSSSKPVDPSKSSAGSSAAAASPPSAAPNPVQSAPTFQPGVAAPNTVDGGNRAASAGVETISVTVAPFTGGPFVVTVRKTDSVEELKRAVAKKLKVLKDRICLLYRER